MRNTLLFFALLLIPIGATFFLPPDWIEVVGPLWFLALVPTVHLASRSGWAGAAIAMAASVGVVVVTYLVAGAAGRGVPENLVWVLPLFLVAGISVGWLSERLGGTASDSEGEQLTDRLTGLPSQKQVRLLLENEFWAARRGRPVAVVLFAMEDFVAYLNREGDEAAARSLVVFGDILKSTTRRMNLSGRLRPDRFISILDGSDEEGAVAFANRVREAFSRAHSDGAHPGVSAGIASFRPSMTDPDDLMAAAELALQRAREGGGDCVRVFGRPASTGGPVPHGPSDEDVGMTTGAAAASLDTDVVQTDSTSEGESSGWGGAGRRILVVEEETSVRTLIATRLRKAGFEVLEGHDAMEGVKALAEEFDLVISDLRLPGLPGHNLVSTVKARWPETPVVVITGFRDAKLAAEALNAGADRYLFKPFGMSELEGQMRELLERREEIRAAREGLPDPPGEPSEETKAARETLLSGLRGLAEAAELRDPCTLGHSRRVTLYSLALLDALGPEDHGIDRERLRLACELHDLGKLSVPEAILNKPAPLTDEEYQAVRRHPQTSRTILEPLLEDELVLAVAAWHHERWDGKGYPDHLAGESIPFPARLVAMADALDAMTSPRAYRAPLDWDDAVEQIRARTGTHFDPGLLEAFKAALPGLEDVYRTEHRESPVPASAPTHPDESAS